MDARPDTLMLQGRILGRGHFSKYLMAGTRSQEHFLRYAAMDLSESPSTIRRVLSGFRTTKRTTPTRSEDAFFGDISRN